MCASKNYNISNDLKYVLEGGWFSCEHKFRKICPHIIEKADKIFHL